VTGELSGGFTAAERTVMSALREVPTGQWNIHDQARAVIAGLARFVEGPASPWCTCTDVNNLPISPATRKVMHHHCDCQAVDVAAVLLGSYTKTVHAGQCGHGGGMVGKTPAAAGRDDHAQP
jgi:hypothetical protein